MKVTVERTQPDEALVTVEVEAERAQRAVEEAVRRLGQRYAFAGFRRGKAPRPIVEAFLGRDAILQEALGRLVEETFDEAVEQEGLRPVGSADLEGDPAIVEGQPLTYTARVAVRPPIELGDVRDLRVEVERREVDEQAVDAFLEEYRRQHAREREADRVGEQSLVRAEVTTEIGGEVVEGPRRTVLDMQAGDGDIAGLAAALNGSPVGETREVVWTVPATAPAHAGEEALTRIRVLGVVERELPPLDDALARHAGAESVADLRTKARAYLEAQERRREREARLDAAVDALVDRVAVAVPKPLVERQSDILWEEFALSLRQQGVPVEAYLAAANKDEAALREEMRPAAERRAKRNMVLEALAEREGLEPLEGEIAAAADRLLGRPEKGRRDGQRTLSRGQRAYIRDVLLREKALAFLADIYAPADEGEGEAPEGEAEATEAASGDHGAG